jgi:hypothetical protein
MAESAFKTKNDLKDVFSGLSSIFVQKGGLTDFKNVTFDYDMPVTVDSLSISVSDPTLNRTKVHGLNADWTVTATPGELTFSATVPSISEELVKYFMGEANKLDAVAIKKAGAEESTSYTGFSATIKTLKIYMGLGLLSEDGEKLVLIKKMAVYATPLYENASTTPFGFKLTGTIEASDVATGEGEEGDDIAFLTKAAA